MAWIGRGAGGETARFNEEVAINTTRGGNRFTGTVSSCHVTGPSADSKWRSSVHRRSDQLAAWRCRTGCSRSQLFDVSADFEVMFSSVISV